MRVVSHNPDSAEVQLQLLVSRIRPKTESAFFSLDQACRVLTQEKASDRDGGFFSWGEVLAARARSRPETEADRLFELAYQKYAAALAIKPDKQEALYNWGLALVDQGRTKQDSAAARLLDFAAEKLTKAEGLLPGSGSYLLACIASLQGAEEECRRWLESCNQQGKLPDRDSLLADQDLAAVREREWFHSLIDDPS